MLDLIKHLIGIEYAIGIKHFLHVAHPVNGHRILGIMQIILFEKTDAMLGTDAALQFGRVLVDKWLDTLVDVLVELLTGHVQMQIGVAQMSIAAHNCGQWTASLPHDIHNAIEIAQRQRYVILEAEALLDEAQRHHFANFPNLLHLAGLPGNSAIQYFATFHALANELIDLLLVMCAIAAGGLDEHVEGIARDGRAKG